MAKNDFLHLKEKWSAHHKKSAEKLWQKHKDSLNWLAKNTKQLAVGSMAGLMLLSTPSALTLSPSHALSTQENILPSVTKTQDIGKKFFLINDLYNILPKEVRILTSSEEEEIGGVLSRWFNMKVSASLDGKRLNRSYGLIGAEQHLARYPGDSMSTHFDNQEDTRLYFSSGMAPGLGGWGYFMEPGEQKLSEKDKQREKYYIAVQTFLAPGFDKNPKEIIDFFRFRKMLLVNPQNGKAVVTVVGDAGPSEFTGKHLGGSPEVMLYLERFDGEQKGPVLYFLIDDKEDKVKLGPIDL